MQQANYWQWPITLRQVLKVWYQELYLVLVDERHAVVVAVIVTVAKNAALHENATAVHTAVHAAVVVAN